MNKMHLRALKKWSDDVKETIQMEELPEEMRHTWVSWDEEIQAFLKTGVEQNQLIKIQNQGEELRQHLMASAKESVRQDYANHVLPALPYAYNALEPYISEEIMRLHHLVHHQAYVDGLNKAEEEIYYENHEPDMLRHWLREQAFNGSGHLLHSVFWQNMTPYSAKVPSKQIAQAINRDFGSFAHFKEQFTNVAKSIQGPGWAALLYDPVNHRLVIESIEEHQNNQLVSMIPLLVLDIWEHAYYLQYKTGKADYIDAWWNVVNWEDVNNRLLSAMNSRD
ncbi:superoxide dismutase [Oceanobacillus alkalisoli]|uniref:superoxide dismutase n=1 Tax=Oceanobacillus alkalisoli TaxID=2925113 RepID=UPI001F11C1AE|nr:superoxide dismutase [Oceanobacillus alkalisoli]MCF3941683.1 superoxide dismutase [Oceanobacillus alkalisoli]